MTEQPKSYTDKEGNKVWYLLPSKDKDCYHRLDGPAIEHADGRITFPPKANDLEKE